MADGGEHQVATAELARELVGGPGQPPLTLPPDLGMQVVDLSELPLQEAFDGLGSAFPISSGGTTTTAVVYMELEPGGALPEHRDSAEEILVGLEGAVEAFVGDERTILAEGQMALVPAMEPHGLVNTGDRRTRVLGFFGGSTNLATFTERVEPGGWQVFVVGAPMPLAAPIEEPLALGS
jgi:quercetin dioxygenase-like cupin family protein